MKKLKLMIFAIIASILFVPALSVAAQDKEVSNFNDFKTNVANASARDVIKLTQNITDAQTLTISKSVTIDLNGHTYEGADLELIIITGEGVEVTIQDSGTSNGKIQTRNTSVNSKIIRMMDHAKLTIKSGTIANNGKGMVGISVEGESSLVMNGTAKVLMTPKTDKKRTYGINIVSGTVDIQTGATVESSDSIGEAVSVKDKLTLSGGTIKSTDGTAIGTTMGKDVTVTINSGTVESTSEYGVKLSNNNHFTMTSGTIKTGIDQRSANITIESSAQVTGNLKINNSNMTNIKGTVSGDMIYSVGVVVKTGSKTGKASLSSTTAKQGDKITLTTEPSEGYRIASIKVVKVGDENTAVEFNEEDSSFIMPNYPVSVYVSYEEITYDINVTAPKGVTATASADKVKPGEDVEVVFKTLEGYKITSVKVNDVEMFSKIEDGKLKISNINEDQNIVITVESTSTAIDNPKTGDNIVTYIALMIVGSIGIIGLTTKKLLLNKIQK